jgi:hypothetical protein
VAGRGARPPRLRVRRRAVPRARSHGNRCRSRLRRPRARARRRSGVVRRLAPGPRPRGDDQDAGGIRRHAPPPRGDCCRCRRRRRRGRGGRNGRAVGRSRGRRAVRPPRNQTGRRSQGLCRSLDAAPGAGRTCACRCCAGPASRSGFTCSRACEPVHAGTRSGRRRAAELVASAARGDDLPRSTPCQAGRPRRDAIGIPACRRLAQGPSRGGDVAHRRDPAPSGAGTGSSARAATREADVPPRRCGALSGSRQDSPRPHAAGGAPGSRGSARGGGCRGAALGARRRGAARPRRRRPAGRADGDRKGRTYH